jgi:hypothetical protein
MLGKDQARTEDVSGAMFWTEGLPLDLEHAIGALGKEREMLAGLPRGAVKWDIGSMWGAGTRMTTS